MRSILRAHVKWLPAGPLLGLMDVCTRAFAGFSIKEASTLDAVSKTKRPILFIHGTADTFVPCAMSQAAYDVCASEKQLILVDGARHGYSYLFAIFTSQAWNMTFSFYHSLLSEPQELDEAARSMQLTRWQRFWKNIHHRRLSNETAA